MTNEKATVVVHQAVERSAYRPHRRVCCEVGSESLTHQSFKEDADINNVLAKYERTGISDQVKRETAKYMDVSSAPDLQDAFEIVRQAEEAFLSMDAELRKRFGNDPVRFVEWVQDPANASEIAEAGLLAEEEAERVVSLSQASLDALRGNMAAPADTPPAAPGTVDT